MDEGAEAEGSDAELDVGAIEIGPRPARRAPASAPEADAASAPESSSTRRTLGLALVVLAAIALFVGGVLLYRSAGGLTTRLPPPQLAQVVEAARRMMRIAAYGMMGGALVALVGYRLLLKPRGGRSELPSTRRRS